MKMSVEELRKAGLIIFEGIVGSQAYGTATPESDVDIKGVFILPADAVLGLGYYDQVNDDKHDTTYYELGRFLELLSTNNPNILELLNLPADRVLYKHELWDELIENKDKFISKACKNSFAGYAVAQIKKARGLNKKIVNPIAKEKKSPLDFCYVIGGNDTKNGSYPLTKWLMDNSVKQSHCGLSAVPNARDVYALYVSDTIVSEYKGIVKEKDGEFVSNELRMTSIPKGHVPEIFISYNKDGYMKYCKDYKAYWNWVENRNEARYNDTADHGKGYDGKNMMHCYRLVSMAKEVAEGKGINVARPDRDKLMSIRKGEYNYDELVNEAERMIAEVDELFDASDLPEQIDRQFVSGLLVMMRRKFERMGELTSYKPTTEEEIDLLLNVERI